MIMIIVILLIAIILFICFLLFITFSTKSKQLITEAITPINIDNRCIHRLSSAIAIPTVSYDEIEKIDYSTYDAFHDFLKSSFPLIYSKLTIHKINRSLVFEWKGKNTDLKPIILMAHYDVVPANGEWQEQPFSGAIKDGYVWGRGTLDDKSSLMAILEATELLLSVEMIPQRSIYIAIGEDEETSGQNGAISIVQWMKQRSIEAEFILDEGMVIADGLVTGISKPVAMIGTSEKGFLTLKLSTEVDGGHASMPSNLNAINILANASLRLQNKGFNYKATEPVIQFWNYIGPEMPFFKKILFSNQWLFKNLLIKAFAASNSGKALLRTTIATTIFKSGLKENVIPSAAEMIINIRTIPGKNNTKVLNEVKKIINDDKIKINVIKSIDASPVSPVNNHGFYIIQKSIGQVYTNTIVAPSLMIAGTDSKHYTSISKAIYRFLPLQLTQDDLKTFHGANEKISIDGYKSMIQFYLQIIKNSQEK